MIAAVLAFVLAAAQTARGAGLSGLDLEGWDRALGAGGSGSLTYTHAALGDQIPGFPQVWIRTEPLGPAAPSTLQLVEFDCAARTLRLRESYSYASKNLTGPRRQLFFGRKPWRPLLAQAGSGPIFVAACDQ